MSQSTGNGLISTTNGLASLKTRWDSHIKIVSKCPSEAENSGNSREFLLSNSNCGLNTRRSVLILVPLEPQGLKMVKNVSFRFSTYFGKSG